MNNNNKTLRELLDEMKRIEQNIADHKQQVKDVISNNITEDVFTKLESYDLETIDKISKRMFDDVLKYADDKSDEEKPVEKASDIAMETENIDISDDKIDSYISIPEIRQV